MEVVESFRKLDNFPIYLPNIYLPFFGTHSQGRFYEEKEGVGRRNAGYQDCYWAPSIYQTNSRCPVYVTNTSTPHKDPRKCLLRFPSVLSFHSPFLPSRTMIFNMLKYMDTLLGGHMAINIWRVCIFLFNPATYFWDHIRYWTLFEAEWIKRGTEKTRFLLLWSLFNKRKTKGFVWWYDSIAGWRLKIGQDFQHWSCDFSSIELILTYRL